MNLISGSPCPYIVSFFSYDYFSGTVRNQPLPRNGEQKISLPILRIRSFPYYITLLAQYFAVTTSYRKMVDRGRHVFLLLLGSQKR